MRTKRYKINLLAVLRRYQALHLAALYPPSPLQSIKLLTVQIVYVRGYCTRFWYHLSFFNKPCSILGIVFYPQHFTLTNFISQLYIIALLWYRHRHGDARNYAVNLSQEFLVNLQLQQCQSSVLAEHSW